MFSILRNNVLELERWLSSKEYLLLFQRTRVQFPTPTWWFTTACNSSSRQPHTLPSLCKGTHAGTGTDIYNRLKKKVNRNKVPQHNNRAYIQTYYLFNTWFSVSNSSLFASKTSTFSWSLFNLFSWRDFL